MIAVFFSFKGGVGRSSCMLNASRILAQQGRDCLIMDFDISAPGLDIFDGTDLKVLSREKAKIESAGFDEEKLKEFRIAFSPWQDHQQGVTEFLTDYIKNYNKDKVEFPKIDEYIYPFYKTESKNGKKDDSKTNYLNPLVDKEEGRLDIMRAGFHVSTQENQGGPDLDKDISGSKNEMSSGTQTETVAAYDNKQMELDRMITNMLTFKELELQNPKNWDSDCRSQPELDYWHKRPELFENLRKKLNDLPYDYILIDGRPGLSAISVMAMQKLADVVVLCFNLNPWNYNAICNVYQKLDGQYEVFENKGIRKKDDGEWNPFILNKNQKIVLVVTPIPRYARQYKEFNDRYKNIYKHMGNAVNGGGLKERQPIVIPYNEQMALRDKLIADDPEMKKDATTQGYRDIADLLIALNQEDIQNKINRALGMHDANETLKELEQLSNNTEGRNRVRVLHAHGKFFLDAGRYQEAFEVLFKANQECEKMAKETNIELNSRSDKRTLKYTGQSDVCQLAGISKVNEIRSLGFTSDVTNEKKIKELSNADKLFDKAINLINESGTGLSDKAKERKKGEVYLARGNTFLIQAEYCNSEEKIQKLKKAEEHLKKAVKLDSNEPEYHFALGRVRSIIASEIESDKTLNSMIYVSRTDLAKDFQRAIQRRESYAEAYFEWGKSLHFQASLEDDHGNKEKLREDAQNKFDQAISLRQDYSIAYYYKALTQTGALDEFSRAGEKMNISASCEANERKQMIKEACVYFSQATAHQKDFKEAYFYWGAALIIRCQQNSYLIEENKNAVKKATSQTDISELNSEIEKDQKEFDLDFRDAFYKLEQAIALFFDYPDFYFDPPEIDQMVENLYLSVDVLEKLFSESENFEVFKAVRTFAEIPKDFTVRFEPQFRKWLNKEEEEKLDKLITDNFQKPTKVEQMKLLMIKSAFKAFLEEVGMSDVHQKQKFGEDKIDMKNIDENWMTEKIKEIAKTEKWKNRKN